MKKNKGWLVFGIVMLILIIDQVLKVYIKLNYHWGEKHCIAGGKLCLYFIENKGMAWGTELTFLGEYGKPALTIFRIFAAIAIGYYIHTMIKAKAHLGFIITLSLILAGALGNIIDSIFYGMIFTMSPERTTMVAQLVPWGQGYERFLHGHVVDMFSTPLFDWPLWMPFIGGNTFFGPIFNVADSAITTGVFSILLFQKKFFPNKVEESPKLSENKSETSIE